MWVVCENTPHEQEMVHIDAVTPFCTYQMRGNDTTFGCYTDIITLVIIGIIVNTWQRVNEGKKAKAGYTVFCASQLAVHLCSGLLWCFVFALVLHLTLVFSI